LEKDPVTRFKTKLLERGIMTEKEATLIEGEVALKIDQATKYAKESSFPTPASALEDLYA
jgi:pyruvate dehydrogenase E1 component alpha subunit